MPCGFSDWESLYRNTEAETMPWFSRALDADLEQELRRRNITKGRFLDLGTGPGTQAVELSRMGFDVTGTDISESAVEKAKKLPGRARFIVDDVLDSKLKDRSFDYIFDRGTFHTIEPDGRRIHIRTVKRILADSGILFLKCMSIKEKIHDMPLPHKFSEQDIKNIFGRDFIIESIKDTVYQGISSPPPRALFAVLRKK